MVEDWQLNNRIVQTSLDGGKQRPKFGVNTGATHVGWTKT